MKTKDNKINEFIALIDKGECPENFVLSLSYRTLDDEFNLIEDHSVLTEDDIVKITTALSSGKCPKNMRILLDNRNLDDGSARLFAEALKTGNCPTGLYLCLTNNKFTREGLIIFADALKSGKCPDNFNFDLSYKNIMEPLPILLDALNSNKCPNGLTLNMNELIEYAKDKSACMQAIVNVLIGGNCPENLQLNFDKCNISNEYAIMMATVFSNPNCPQSLYINMENNSIDDRAIIAIASILKHSPEGKNSKINFSGSKAKTSLHALAESMTYNTSIVEFKINLDIVKRRSCVDYSPEPKTIIENCFIRNKLIAKYKNHADIVYFTKRLSQEAGYYAGSLQGEPFTLKMLVALQVNAMSDELKKDLPKDLPKDLLDYMTILNSISKELNINYPFKKDSHVFPGNSDYFNSIYEILGLNDDTTPSLPAFPENRDYLNIIDEFTFDTNEDNAANEATSTFSFSIWDNTSTVDNTDHDDDDDDDDILPKKPKIE